MLKFSVDIDKAIELGLMLKIAREKTHLSTQEANKLSGVSATDINDLENGKRMRINPLHLKQLSIIYKINILDLFKVIDYIDDESIDNYCLNQNVNSKIMNTMDDIENKYSKIPLYKIKGNTLDNVQGFIQIPTEEDSLSAIFMPDSSMEPVIKVNDIILFDPKISKLGNGQTGIFSLNEDILIRKFYTVDDEIILNAYNSSSSPIIIKNKDKFNILGLCYRKINNQNI